MLGPDLTDKIVALMAKFREEPVKKMADIESTFQQVLAAEKKTKVLGAFYSKKMANVIHQPQVII